MQKKNVNKYYIIVILGYIKKQKTNLALARQSSRPCYINT